ncbi:Carbon monoxide dehydrogenase medium chain [Rhodoplanes serenus]|uniref:Carbon monoxide dehydrogenase medium chain n=1 Tax=Rhodoplanes serenus TaxID=200615 RepID=A0A3S4BJ83_9BRAD|nr:xanthine dehydrogenase family protein subunit M [Rhodoplanes serenus]VCU11231.1 Carbon monoxide dehydrogenase medium chain [Rhodoplanes serenus]
MKPFGYVAAKDSEHAVALLAEYGKGAKVLAGGTDLLADLKFSPHPPPDVVVDISRAADLKGIALTDAGLRLGAMVTHSEIVHSPLIAEAAPALAEAAVVIGAVQTRNLGTIGGNLITCVPSMDSGPTLLALDARVTVLGPRGRREMPLSELFVGPRRTSLAFDEILIEIVVPKQNLHKPAAFQKFGLRKGQALALVNAAASFWAPDGVFTEPRIALGAVAPTVIRAPKAEAYLTGRPVSEEAMAEAGRIAATEAKPITDFRASAEYRRDLVAVLVKRALAGAFGRVTPNQKDLAS